MLFFSYLVYVRFALTLYSLARRRRGWDIDVPRLWTIHETVVPLIHSPPTPLSHPVHRSLHAYWWDAIHIFLYIYARARPMYRELFMTPRPTTLRWFLRPRTHPPHRDTTPSPTVLSSSPTVPDACRRTEIHSRRRRRATMFYDNMVYLTIYNSLNNSYNNLSYYHAMLWWNTLRSIIIDFVSQRRRSGALREEGKMKQKTNVCIPT